MTYIKKIVMQGFKSFAKRTEIIFSEGVNVIVGPNGSGKSNISDAICFALGRLSIKSMRADKSKNLIFMGSKNVKPAKEAFVEVVFDNSDKSFIVDAPEVVLKREINSRGLSKYSINGETKTRGDIIEILGRAGIDPYGYNIILQGQIQTIVKMSSEERRKIIEEVAGISVYEWRKEQSQKELSKTEERLKEVSTILRERGSFLNNLEKEKAQAQRYQDLQLTVRKTKASIIKKKLDEKIKEISSIEKSIDENSNLKEKKLDKLNKMQEIIDDLTRKVSEINKEIRRKSGIEQNELRSKITMLKAELEGLKARREGAENRKKEIEQRIFEMEKSIPELEKEIKALTEESPLIAEKAKQLKKKKEELTIIEEERKKFLTLKTNLQNLKERLEDKKIELERVKINSESLLKEIENLNSELMHSSEKEILKLIQDKKLEITKERNFLTELNEKEIRNEKLISIAENEIKSANETKNKVENFDICPLCKSKITEEHLNHVFNDCDYRIKNAEDTLTNAKSSLNEIKIIKEKTINKLENLESSIRVLEKELAINRSIVEKRELLKKTIKIEESLKKELDSFLGKKISLEEKINNLQNIEEKYYSKIHEIEEISSRTTEDVKTALLYKERELEKIKKIIERGKEDLDDLQSQIKELDFRIEKNEELIFEREKQEKEMNIKFDKMYKQRDKMQEEIQETSTKLFEIQNEVRQIEDQINYLKIGKAKCMGEKEMLELDFSDFKDVELLDGSINYLEERLKKAQESLQAIGSINMRALEVYESVKKEYESVKEKVDVLEKEKEEIMKVIEQIDKKKKKTFIKTFDSINELFTRNFSKLYLKGAAYLKLESKDDIFSGGVEIVVKMGKGKYFDVNALSGGEQTLVALSLLFAIQEHKPYHFYLLDEIDASLDKRNSEKLATLLNRHTTAGQYIIITHNDALIFDSQILYGVSMHEGVSKILSLYLGNKNEISEIKKEIVTDKIIENIAKTTEENSLENDELDKQISRFSEEVK